MIYSDRKFQDNSLFSIVDLMAEAQLLRQHKGRLEARMQILEDHNRQLEGQLQRLRQLLDQVTFHFSYVYLHHIVLKLQLSDCSCLQPPLTEESLHPVANKTGTLQHRHVTASQLATDSPRIVNGHHGMYSIS